MPEWKSWAYPSRRCEMVFVSYVHVLSAAFLMGFVAPAPMGPVNMLAIRRGENEGVLFFLLELEAEHALAALRARGGSRSRDGFGTGLRGRGFSAAEQTAHGHTGARRRTRTGSGHKQY